MQQKTARTLILCIGLACTLALACSAAEHREPINILFSGSANGILRSCHCPNAPWGGLAKRAWLIDRLRSVAGAETTIVLDTGDIFPVDRSLEQASLMVNLLALMNYDAVAVGDQELREGIDAWIAVNRQAVCGMKTSTSPPCPGFPAAIAWQADLDIAKCSYRPGL